MEGFWKIIQVILLSSVKFIAGPPFAYYNTSYNFSIYQTILFCVTGGMLGVVVFTYLSGPIFRLEHLIVLYFRKIREKRSEKKSPFSHPLADVNEQPEIHYEYVDRYTRKRNIFNKRNRRIVLIWKRFGLAGIAIITPVLLSIPIGTIIANSLAKNKKKILIYMLASVIFWSVLMTLVFEILHVATIKDLQEQVVK